MKTVVIRVTEWSAWLPANKDPHVNINIHEGLTAFQAEDNEKLLEVAVTATGVSRSRPEQVPVGPDEEPQGIVDPQTKMQTINRPYGLYLFQAMLAHERPVDEAPEPIDIEGTEGHAVVLPGASNRAARRSQPKGKGKR